MSQVSSDQIVVECGCGKRLRAPASAAGKKAKCPKCGNVLQVPIPQREETDDGGLNDLYALAEKEQQVAAAQESSSALRCPSCGSAMEAGLTQCPACGFDLHTQRKARPAKTSGGPPSAAVGYFPGSKAREVEKTTGSALMDMNRDVYVPLALMVCGFAIYVGYYWFRYSLSGTGVAATTFGLGIITCFKALLLIGFALVMAGPLGVSFGGIWTAALKLAAIAVFCDGLTTWVDAGVDKLTGTHGGFSFGTMLSFPVLLGAYWLLLIYLFSMDPGDSWMVVVLLSVFDFIVRMVLVAILLNIVLGWGGVPSGAIPTPAFGGGSSSSTASDVVHFNDLEEGNFLREARQYIKDGHQGAAGPTVEAWYKAGCKNVWFEIEYDFNRKTTPNGLVVELPKTPEQRAEAFKVLEQFYKEYGYTPSPDELKDHGEHYIYPVLR